MSDHINLEDNGDVIFLARAPGQVADNTKNATGASVIRGAKSGNSRFDPGTGRFAKKDGAADKVGEVGGETNPIVVTPSGIPQGVDVQTWLRRMDLVRDAARELTGEITNENISTFLDGKVQDLSQVNIDQFLLDVKVQRMNDLADAFHEQLRGKTGDIQIKSSGRSMKRVLNSLGDEQVIQLIQRLTSRGWDTDTIKSKVVAKVRDKDRRTRLEQSIG